MGEEKPQDQAAPQLQMTPQAPAQPKTSGMAIAALILAILPTCITQLAAIVLGIVSLVKISKSQGRLKGRGLAIAAIVIAPLMLFIALPVGLVIPRLAVAREHARRASCMNNLRQIGMAIEMYQSDYGNWLPNTGKPNDGAASLAKLQQSGFVADLRVFRCPSVEKASASSGSLTENECSYEYLNMTNPKAHGDTILLYDKSGNHKDGRNVLYMDGRVQWMSEADFQRELRAQMAKAESPGP